MNNNEGKMEKQNGHVSRKWASGRGAAGSVVQVPKARVAESRHGQTAWDRRAAQEWVCAPPPTTKWALGWGSAGHTGSFQEPWY